MLIKFFNSKAINYSLLKKKEDNYPVIFTKMLLCSTKSLNKDYKSGLIYIKCTKRNIFCTLIDTLSNKVKSSCSLRVPDYKNEFNERENFYTRGLLLGKFFGNKLVSLGYKKIIIFFTGINKGRSGVIRSLSKIGIEIYSTLLITRKAHNGCRPIKNRRKKFRTKVRGFL